MAMNTPVISAGRSGLDSLAVVDGEPIPAHVTNWIASTANRLLTQPAPLFSFSFATQAVGSRQAPGSPASAWLCRLFPSEQYTRICPPIAFRKMPGHRTARVSIRGVFVSGISFKVVVASRAAMAMASDLNSASFATISFQGTGSAQVISAEIPLLPGGSEEIEIFAKAIGATFRGGTLGSTGTYGAPNSGGPSSGNNYLNFSNNHAYFGSVGGGVAWSWNDEDDASDWARGGHYIVWPDANLSSRITSVPRTYYAMTYEEVSPADLRKVLSSGNWEIRSATTMQIYNIAGMTLGRET